MRSKPIKNPYLSVRRSFLGKTTLPNQNENLMDTSKWRNNFDDSNLYESKKDIFKLKNGRFLINVKNEEVYIVW